jgi:2-polyprenyl-3-methyl-5-hydroxy-6-metoxy-1,4-benzoquinol methylase
MKANTENPFVSFYTKHNISPVHQDISDFPQHMKRREKLYRSLGLPPFAFVNENMLEIGPGGGYNALAFFQWGAKVDFVEPNKTAQEELPVLLKKSGVKPEAWHLFPGLIEDYYPEKSYNIVIAEGFIPGLLDRRQVIARLKDIVNPGGVVVVTCVDDISFFFDHLKGLVAARLISTIGDFQEQVKVLIEAFASHLQTLKHASRPVDDWVIDTFLNPAIYGEWFSIADCLEEFGRDFELLGSSPRMFTDYTWYKNTEHDTFTALLEQFHTKRQALFFQHMEEKIRTADVNRQLFEACYHVRDLGRKLKDNYQQDTMRKIVEAIKVVRTLTVDFDPRATAAIDEAISLLSDDDLTPAKVANATKLAAACGRSMQYVSLVKKVTD